MFCVFASLMYPLQLPLLLPSLLPLLLLYFVFATSHVSPPFVDSGFLFLPLAIFIENRDYFLCDLAIMASASGRGGGGGSGGSGAVGGGGGNGDRLLALVAGGERASEVEDGVGCMMADGRLHLRSMEGMEVEWDEASGLQRGMLMRSLGLMSFHPMPHKDFPRLHLVQVLMQDRERDDFFLVRDVANPEDMASDFCSATSMFSLMFWSPNEVIMKTMLVLVRSRRMMVAWSAFDPARWEPPCWASLGGVSPWEPRRVVRRFRDALMASPRSGGGGGGGGSGAAGGLPGLGDEDLFLLLNKVEKAVKEELWWDVGKHHKYLPYPQFVPPDAFGCVPISEVVEELEDLVVVDEVGGEAAGARACGKTEEERVRKRDDRRRRRLMQMWGPAEGERRFLKGLACDEGQRRFLFARQQQQERAQRGQAEGEQRLGELQRQQLEEQRRQEEEEQQRRREEQQRRRDGEMARQRRDDEQRRREEQERRREEQERRRQEQERRVDRDRRHREDRSRSGGVGGGSRPRVGAAVGGGAGRGSLMASFGRGSGGGGDSVAVVGQMGGGGGSGAVGGAGGDDDEVVIGPAVQRLIDEKVAAAVERAVAAVSASSSQPPLASSSSFS